MLFFEYPNYYATKVTFTKHSRQKIRKNQQKNLKFLLTYGNNKSHNLGLSVIPDYLLNKIRRYCCARNLHLKPTAQWEIQTYAMHIIVGSETKSLSHQLTVVVDLLLKWNLIITK